MNVTESFLTAVDRLLANKLRAMLTMLGVIIGVSAVIQGTQEVVYNGRSSRITVSGVTANYFTVNNLNDFQSGDGFASNGEAVYVPLTTAQSRLYPPFGPAPVKKPCRRLRPHFRHLPRLAGGWVAAD